MAMTALERLAAAAAGRPTDRLPLFCNLLDQGAHELGMSLRDYYARGAHVAEGQVRLREKFGYDNVWSLFYVGREAELLGCRDIHFSESGPPNVAEFVIRDPADIARLKIPDNVARHPAFEGPAECLRLLRHEVGGRHPICAYITSTMTLPALLMGMESWMALLLTGDASLRDALLEKCHEFFVKEVTAYRAAGADIILYANPFGSTDTVSHRFFLAYVLPWIGRDLDAIGTSDVVYYCGMSRMARVLDDVLTRTPLAACYLSPLDRVADAKAVVNGRALTAGVINDARMIDWTPDAIAAEVERLADDGLPDGRFMLGTGVMPLDIPDANIRAFVSAAIDAGSRVAEARG